MATCHSPEKGALVHCAKVPEDVVLMQSVVPFGELGLAPGSNVSPGVRQLFFDEVLRREGNRLTAPNLLFVDGVVQHVPADEDPKVNTEALELNEQACRLKACRIGEI